MELWSAERVLARIDAQARAQPGGVVATDGDGTLWSGDVGEDLFHAFLRHGRVEAPALEAMQRTAREHDLSDAGTGADIALRLYSAYREGRFPERRICELMTWCFAGWSRGEVRTFAHDVVERGDLSSRVHEEVMRILEPLRRQGVSVVVVSASPFDVVVEAATKLGFPSGSVVAAEARFDDGECMLAEVEEPIPYAEGKVTRLRERIGATRELYAALGDNGFDAALLASAGVGIAVRPKPRLRQVAHEIVGLIELAR